MHSLFAHWTADLPRLCQRSSDAVTLYTPRNLVIVGQLLGWFCASRIVTASSSEQFEKSPNFSPMNTKWLTSNSITIPKVPVIDNPKYNQWSDYQEPYGATILQNLYVWLSIFHIPIEKTVLPLISLMVKVIRPSLTVLPLKMCCLFSMNREDNMPAQNYLTRAGKRPLVLPECVPSTNVSLLLVFVLYSRTSGNSALRILNLLS